MHKKVFISLLILVGLGLLLLFLRGDEDGWICNNGTWKKHGNPSVAAPVSGCGLVKSNFTTTTVKVYFSNNKTDPNFLDCNLVDSVDRVITSTPAVGRAALNELLKGPTAEEKTMGYFTNVNPGVEINSLEISNGVAEVDFSAKLDERVGGSCRVTNIRSQIENTLKQFTTVKNVIIKVEGRIDDVLQP